MIIFYVLIDKQQQQALVILLKYETHQIHFLDKLTLYRMYANYYNHYIR
jgi:hypothetical protein